MTNCYLCNKKCLKRWIVTTNGVNYVCRKCGLDFGQAVEITVTKYPKKSFELTEKEAGMLYEEGKNI